MASGHEHGLKFMKHTIRGKHGHHYRFNADDLRASIAAGRKRGHKSLFRNPKNRVCVSASECASSDFMSEEIVLRERISLRWNVCMWCWSPKPGQGLYGFRGGKRVLIAKECGIGKCKAWGKPQRVNGLLTYKMKNNGA